MISALILAAGKSKRMGQPKMLLPWGGTTVLGKVISTFRAAGIEDILVITGGARDQIESIAAQDAARCVFNPHYTTGDMLTSLQIGLRNLSAEATLIALGDQPQVRERTVRLILEEYARSAASLIVPSYNMRRGHPWLVARAHWDEILLMGSQESPRLFLNRHTDEIVYIEVDDPSILQDLDTPEDYLKLRP